MSAQLLEFHLFKYPFLRHIYRKHRGAPYGFYSKESFHDSYVRKKEARLLRRKLLTEDVDAQNFFAWIWSIQKKLGWNNVKFAEELGVSLQTLKLWRNFHGHFPSQRSLKKLLELDRLTTICITKKIVYGVTTSNLILK